MTKRTSLKRLLASGALLIWCALSVIVPAADAAAERASNGSRAHVEAVGGSATCAPVHDHLACQLCRLLRLPIKSGNATILFAIADVAHVAQPSNPTLPSSRDHETGQFSRAPPSV